MIKKTYVEAAHIFYQNSRIVKSGNIRKLIMGGLFIEEAAIWWKFCVAPIWMYETLYEKWRKKMEP